MLIDYERLSCRTAAFVFWVIPSVSPFYSYIWLGRELDRHIPLHLRRKKKHLTGHFFFCRVCLRRAPHLLKFLSLCKTGKWKCDRKSSEPIAFRADSRAWKGTYSSRCSRAGCSLPIALCCANLLETLTLVEMMQCYWKSTPYIWCMSPAGLGRMPVHVRVTLPYYSSPECKSFIYNWFLTFWKLICSQVNQMKVMACIFRGKKKSRDINKLISKNS